jgi:hypothetical protein
MDLENTLFEDQHPPTIAEIAKTKNLPYREGIGPLTHTPKPDSTFPMAIDAEFLEERPQISSNQFRGGGEASWVNPRKDTEGATTKGLEGAGSMHANAPKCDLQDWQ